MGDIHSTCIHELEWGESYQNKKQGQGLCGDKF